MLATPSSFPFGHFLVLNCALTIQCIEYTFYECECSSLSTLTLLDLP